MKKKLILLVTCLAFLAGCTSSIDDSASNPIVLQTFGDDAGIARATITEDGITKVAIVTEGNIVLYSPDPTDLIDSNGLVITSSNAYGDFYGGTLTINDTLFNVVYYEDSTQQVAGAYLVGSSEGSAIVYGNEVSNIPSGSYSYTGTNIVGLRDGSYIEYGTFIMGVNFTSSTASLSATTENSSIVGEISINSSDGTFTSNNLNWNETISNNSGTATINGNFHGSGATGVTGMYTDNEATPTYTGAIIGTR